MIQPTFSAYTVTNTMPIADVNKTSTKDVMKRSTSLRLFAACQVFPAPLVFKDRIGQRERSFHTIRIQLCTGLLGDDVDIVILKILRKPRNECHTYGGGQ